MSSPYAISYLVVGVLLAIAAAVHSKKPRSKLLIRTTVIIVFWPLLILMSPDFFVQQKYSKDKEKTEEPDHVFSDLDAVSVQDMNALSVEERSRLERVKRVGEDGTTFFTSFADFGDILRRFWDEGIPPEAYGKVESAKWKLESDYGIESDIRFSLSRREPDWYVGFSTEFVKSIANVDKNRRAKLLEVIGQIAAAPTSPHGDTVKPLAGNMTGLWRFRIGDDRLIYKPNVETKKIVLVSFGPRGEIYK